MNAIVTATLRNLRAIGLATVAALALSTPALASSPDEIIKTATDTVRGNIAANVEQYRADKSAFYEMVDEEIVPHFDTVYIAKVILGRHLKQASETQIGQFEEAFKTMLVRSYADRLLEYYDSVEIEVRPARIDGDGKKASVDTNIVRKNGKPPIPVTFSMRKPGEDWKIWDIKAENISLVLNFRTQIDAEIKKTDIASVIDRLQSNQLQIGAETDDAQGEGRGS